MMTGREHEDGGGSRERREGDINRLIAVDGIRGAGRNRKRD